MSDETNGSGAGEEGWCPTRARKLPLGQSVTDRCTWGEKGLPACQQGIRDRRYWCAACSAKALATPDADDANCHCGRSLRYGFDGDPKHHRGMCADCDEVRCDAYPQDCPWRHFPKPGR